MQKYIAFIIAALVVGGGSFYAGMKYDQSHTTAGAGAGRFANLSPEERQTRLQQFSATASGMRGGSANGGFITGEIIAKDGQSITVKLRDGGSKIIFLSRATQVLKSIGGSFSDLISGEQIAASGQANPDGSISAQSIQIRPEAPREP